MSTRSCWGWVVLLVWGVGGAGQLKLAHLKSCLVELNYSHSLPPCVLCRCTSCRVGVVTMAAKLTENRGRDGGQESQKTHPVLQEGWS